MLAGVGLGIVLGEEPGELAVVLGLHHLSAPAVDRPHRGRKDRPGRRLDEPGVDVRGVAPLEPRTHVHPERDERGAGEGGQEDDGRPEGRRQPADDRRDDDRQGRQVERPPVADDVAEAEMDRGRQDEQEEDDDGGQRMFLAREAEQLEGHEPAVEERPLARADVVDALQGHADLLLRGVTATARVADALLA